jgi:Na+/proline symporter
VAAIAFESVIKLLAFLAVGLFVVYGLFDGLADLFAQARAQPRLANLLRLEQGSSFAWTQWFALTLLSMLSVIFLPRQFQVMVVENVSEDPSSSGSLGFSAVFAGHQPVCAAHCAGRVAVV